MLERISVVSEKWLDVREEWLEQRKMRGKRMTLHSRRAMNWGVSVVLVICCAEWRRVSFVEELQRAPEEVVGLVVVRLLGGQRGPAREVAHGDVAVDVAEEGGGVAGHEELDGLDLRVVPDVVHQRDGPALVQQTEVGEQRQLGEQQRGQGGAQHGAAGGKREQQAEEAGGGEQQAQRQQGEDEAQLLVAEQRVGEEGEAEHRQQQSPEARLRGRKRR